MKTNIKHVVIRPEQRIDEHTGRLHNIELSVRTEDGLLMTNRLLRLLRIYGERLVVPNRLVLEILENRNRKSRDLKALERDLDSYDEAFGAAVGLLIDLYDAAGSLVDELIANCCDDELMGRLTEEVDCLNEVLGTTGEFLDCVVEDCDDECDC